jgi:two-component system, NarL family, nitrate/nitrite response regulator NarL
MPSIACVVVHPSRVFREGLKTILSKSPFDPVCSVSSIDDVPATVGSRGEHVLVLMDVRDGDNLREALSAAKAKFPDGQVVVVGDSRRRELVTTAIASEATSFVDENVATSALIKQLELIAQGVPMISVLLLKRLLGNGSAPPSVEAVPTLEALERIRNAARQKNRQVEPPDTDDEARPNRQLSGREAAILNALVQGTPNKSIAYELNITEATVKVHVKAILRKIQVKNRTQAAIWAVHHQALPKVVHADNGEPGAH